MNLTITWARAVAVSGITQYVLVQLLCCLNVSEWPRFLQRTLLNRSWNFNIFGENLIASGFVQPQNKNSFSFIFL